MLPPGGTRFFCAATGKAIAAKNNNAAIAVWEANFREVRGVRIGNSSVAENNGANQSRIPRCCLRAGAYITT
jgi:hypothetical protein